MARTGKVGSFHMRNHTDLETPRVFAVLDEVGKDGRVKLHLDLSESDFLDIGERMRDGLEVIVEDLKHEAHGRLERGVDGWAIRIDKSSLKPWAEPSPDPALGDGRASAPIVEATGV